MQWLHLQKHKRRLKMKRKNFERNKRVRKRYLDLQYKLDNGLLKRDDEVFALTRQHITGRLTVIKAYPNIAFETTTNDHFWNSHTVIDVYPENYVVIPAEVCFGSGAVAINKEDFKNALLARYRRY